MRSGVTRVAIVAVGLALVLFAVPLAVMSRSLLVDRERAELELAARAATLAVGPDMASGDPIELPTTDPALTVGVYDPGGTLRAGTGPPHADWLVTNALTGTVASGASGPDLAVAVPVINREQVLAVARAAEPQSEVWRQVGIGWALLAAAAAAALIIAVTVARRQARRLTAPLELLSQASVRIAEGDLSARAPTSAIAEIDQVGHTHNAMVAQLAGAIARERHFSADASHQLRTPLTGLQLEIEAALDDPELTGPPRTLMSSTLTQLRQLQNTIDDVLTVARHNPSLGIMPTTGQSLGAVTVDLEARWHGRLAHDGRRLQVVVDQPHRSTLVPGRVVGQIMDVLIDNATTHGHGVVTIDVRDATGAAAITVADEGTLEPSLHDPFERGLTTPRTEDAGTGAGIGLALARTMAEAIGGRLLLAGRAPTQFTLFLPEQHHA